MASSSPEARAQASSAMTSARLRPPVVMVVVVGAVGATVATESVWGCETVTAGAP